MPNPATTLADLLDSWHLPGGKNVPAARGGSPDQLDFWRSQVQAVELLVEVDRAVDALAAMGDPVEHIREDLLPLYKAVFGYAPPWYFHSTPGPQRKAEPSAPATAIRALRTLGVMLNRYLSEELRPATAERLLDLLNEAIPLVGELPADDKTKHYLFDLISDARRGVEEAHLFGAARARAAYVALTTELNGHAATADQQGNTTWAKKAAAWVGASMVAMSVAFGTGIGERASDWVLEKAPEVVAIATTPDDSEMADAEIVDEQPPEDAK
ncbi:hypothetical protein [Nocardiopsis sp. NPDC057823]|uniref:hypothetical protein n=1 Tax=Nocardiopsis sp. NPDC057823 TaxID=3346256 RepID=UPI00366F9D4F